MLDGGCAAYAVRAGDTEAPLPLLACRLDHCCIVGYRHIFVPGEQPGREHPGDAEPGPHRELLLEPDILRIIMGLVPGSGAVFEQGQRQEEVEADKGDRAY